MNKLNNISLYLLVWSIIFEAWDPFNLTGVISVNRMAGLLYAVTSIYSFKQRFNTAGFKQTFILIVLFFFFYSFSSLVNMQYVTDMDSIISFRILQSIIMFILVANHIMDKPMVINGILDAFLISIYIMGVLYIMGVGYDIDAVNKRVSLFGENTNSFGNKAVLGFGIVLYFLFSKRQIPILVKSILIASIPLLFSMVVASGSRGAFLIFIAAGFIALYSIRAKKIYRLFFLVSGITATVLIFDYVLNQESVMQKRVIESIESRSLGGREDLAIIGLKAYLDAPVFGVSRIPLGEAGKYRDPHNIFIAVLLASGIMGFIPFLIINIKIMRNAYSLYKYQGNFIFLLLYGILFLMMMKTGGFIGSKMLWFVYAYIIGSYHAYEQQAKHPKKTL